MWDKIRFWYYDNYGEITWFIIGWCAAVGLQAFNQGDWQGTLFNWGLGILNYILYKR
jgi:hypothetical protein